jgi:cobalt-zinc-cadmium efflux system membrane fusion protein
MNYLKILILAISLITMVTLESCTKSDSEDGIPDERTISMAPKVLNDGETVIVDPKSTNQIESVTIQKSNIASELMAPCKIVISALPVEKSQTPSYLYESNELSEMISEHSKTKADINKSTQTVERFKELVAHQAAAAKELIDAETELSELKTTLASQENKLNVIGLDANSTQSLTSGKVLIIADIPESQIGKIRVGNFAKIVFNAYPTEKFTSKVVHIGKIVDPLTRTIKSQIALDNKDGRLMPGLYGQVMLDINQQSEVAAPVTSIFTARGKYFLFVEKKPGTFERREVLVGVQSNDWVEILKGVDTNDRVVSKGTMLLKALSFGY